MRDDPAKAVTAEAGGAGAAEMLWLLGQPQLSDYLEFVKENVVGGTRMCPRALTDEWRAANDIYYDLEQSEAGIADSIRLRPVAAGLKPLVDELKASPHFLNTFNKLPMTVEMVELDKLIVSQTYVTASFSEGRAAGLSRKPSPEALFRYCQPLERQLPEVRIEKTDHDHYLFSSESTDFRDHRPKLLDEAQIACLSSTGPIAGAIALIVGFGSNYMTAIRSDRRLVLHNGYHRAHSLRSLGIKYAPCLVETVTRKDELRIAAADKVSADPEFYFRGKRPPILRDFFDPRLTRRFAVRRRRTLVEVEFTLRRRSSVEADRP